MAQALVGGPGRRCRALGSLVAAGLLATVVLIGGGAGPGRAVATAPSLTLTKTASVGISDGNPDGYYAYWDITIVNLDTSVAQDVTITDPGAIFKGMISPTTLSTCSMAAPGFTSDSFHCKPSKGGTVKFRVYKAQTIGDRCGGVMHNVATMALTSAPGTVIATAAGDVSLPGTDPTACLAITKAAAPQPNPASGMALWDVSITSTRPDDQAVTIADDGATFVGVQSVSTTGSCVGVSAGQPSPFSCTVKHGKTLTVRLSSAARVCPAVETKNTASLYLASDTALVHPLGSASASLPGATPCVVAPPSLTKTRVSASTAGVPQWAVSIDNPADGAQRNVVFSDAGVALAGALTVTGGATCSGSDPVAGIPCAMPPGSGVSFVVQSDPAPARACSAQTFSNTAHLTVDADVIDVSGGTITLEADPDRCTRPEILKTATATRTESAPAWTISLTNPPATAAGIQRSVIIQDPDAVATAAPVTTGGASCQGSDVAAGMSCGMPPGSSVSISVTAAGDTSRTCRDRHFDDTALLFVDGSSTAVKARGETITLAGDPALCSAAAVSKQPGSYDPATGLATWSVALDNSAADTTDRRVILSDADITLPGGVPIGCATTTNGDLKCDISARSSLTFSVARKVAQECHDTEAVNALIAVYADSSEALAGSPTGPVAVRIPRKVAGCPLPALRKTAASYATGQARWTITVDNSGLDFPARDVVLTDAGAMIVGSPPAGCAGDLASGLACHIAADSTLEFAVGQVAARQCHDRTVSNAATGRLAEGSDLPGSPTAAIAALVPGDASLCRGTVTVKKAYDLNGLTGSVKVPPVITVAGAAAERDGNGGALSDQWLPVTVPSGPVEVAEAAPSGWLPVAAAISGDAGCSPATANAAAQQAERSLDLVSVNVPPDANCVVTFTNRREKGTIRVLVQATSASPAEPATTFAGTFDGDPDLGWGAIAAGQTSSPVVVPSGLHTIQETTFGGNGWTPAGAGVHVLGAGETSCPLDPGQYVAAKVSVNGGADISVCVLNQKTLLVTTGSVTVTKVITGDNPDNSQLFRVAVTGDNGFGPLEVGITNLSAERVAVAFDSDHPATQLTLAEAAVDFYEFVGYAVRAGSLQSCPPGPDRTGAPTVTVDAGHVASTICLYNRPLGQITVTKTTMTNGIADQNAGGWRVTVSSAACAYSATAPTGTTGVARFTAVPACKDFVVSEDSVHGPVAGYFPLGPSTVAGVTVAAGGTADVHFTNARTVASGCRAGTCRPAVTLNDPAPTGVAPTAVPSPAVAGSSPPPVTRPAATATRAPAANAPAVDVVLGEVSPGRAPTPLAPATGSGSPDAGSRARAAAALAALAFACAGLGCALSWRRRGE